MGSIANSIRNAIFGKDVRENIAKGIEATEDLRTVYDQQVINAGNSNSEIVDARGAFSKLKTRLDTSDLILNEKAGIFEISNNILYVYTDSTKTKLISSLNLSSLANTTYIEQYISTLISNGLITGTTIGDRGLNPGKTTFQQLDLSNLTFTSGQYINRNNGKVVSHTSEYYASNLLDFDYSGLKVLLKTCTTNDAAGLAFYDLNGGFISGLITGNTQSALSETEFIVPVGTKKIRFSCVGADKISGVFIAIKSNSVEVSKSSIIKNFNDILSKKLYTNYFYPNDELFSMIKPFSASRGAVSIDKPNRVIYIPASNNVSGASAGVNFLLANFLEELKNNGKISLNIKAHSIHYGTLAVQLYPHNAAGVNFNKPYLTNKYVDNGLGVDIGITITITMNELQQFCNDYGYDIETIKSFYVYIRAFSINANFNCTITNLNFINTLKTDDIHNDIIELKGLLDLEPDDVGVSEIPLTTLKRDGGLFSIFHKVGYIGDSLSSGQHEYTKEDGSTGYIDLFDFSYGQVIARATGTTALNLSSGGRTANTWLTGFASKAFNNPDNLCTAYVIYLGTNDLDKNKNPYGMGNISDIDVNNYNNNGLTFAGRYATIIQRIKEVQPKAKIFCCTLPKTPTSSTDKATNPIIRQIVGLFNDVYLLDLYTYAPLINNSYRIGGHLTSGGYTLFAWHIMSYIDYLIRKYPSDFKEVAFIGTNYHHV